MKEFTLRIELLSDLCVADGGVYNSSIDTEICQDSYGLPYIPAKRIKGCLRECAQELADWGSGVKAEDLFGEGDKESSREKNPGKVRISDAHLLDYKDYVEEIGKGNPAIYHPQNVLRRFSSIRTQTAILDENEDGEINGTAKRNSLRTIRVVNKGECFEADVLLMDDDLKEGLENCCKLFHHMGLARTRGLGEIKVTLKEKSSESDASEHTGLSTADAYSDENALVYNIQLLEPMICKSINGGESNSYDYIEGNKVIGLLAKAFDSNAKLLNVLDDNELVFSNAYITKNDTRFTEIPAYLYSIKNNKTNYINRLVFEDSVEGQKEMRQIDAMKHCYCSMKNAVLEKTSVEMEERYHHSRPEDKSIGRATNEGNSKFYQISSIKAGQCFSGFIKGKPETLRSIHEALSQIDICYMGYGSFSEYGKCKFSIKPIDLRKRETVKGQIFVVALNAPAIVYNSNAMYSTKWEDLLAEILLAAGLKIEDAGKVDTEETKKFLKYTNLGGYNVTWRARKPVISAFDKGTAIKLVFKEEVELETGNQLFIGERNSEGFGECSIEKLNCAEDEKDWVYAKTSSDGQNQEKEVNELGKLICKDLFEDFIEWKAACIVKEELKGLINEKSRPTISNLLLMCTEMKDMNKIKEAIEDRFGKTSDRKRDKKDRAEKIIKCVKSAYSALPEEFCNQMCVEKDAISLVADDGQYKFLKAILVELKHQIRAKKGDA